MKSSKKSNQIKIALKPIKSKNKLLNIKSKYILQKVLEIVPKNKTLKVIKYNKKIQERINIKINDYKEISKKLYSSIIIEIIPDNEIYGEFVNIINKEEEIYYHIFFNDDSKEIQKNYLNEDDKVYKISIVINYQVKSFFRLFEYCECIKYINFLQFDRINITDMSYMFKGCSSLNEINLSNFNTDNVKSMECMFSRCSSLEKLDLSNFNTNKVTNMSNMFYGCKSLKEINISSFNTKNVIDMGSMFARCISLENLKLSNEFNINKNTYTYYMFSECCYKLKDVAKKMIRNIKKDAFEVLY